MKTAVAWINPNCSKSRALLAKLDELGVRYETRLYLENPPDESEVQTLQRALEASSVRDFLRRKEAQFDELGLASASDAELVAAVVAHPILLERPILMFGEQAVIARSPEQFSGFLDQILADA